LSLDPNLIVGIIANLLVIGVAWGSLHQRVKTVESRLAGLEDLDTRMARVETRIDGLYEQMKELNASIRWMREPSPPYRPRRNLNDKDDQ
jgi:hypothetical protein